MAKKKELAYLMEESEGAQTAESRLKQLKKKLKECQKEKEEYLSQAQRARADLINYRRRQEAMMPELIKAGQSDLIRELLPVLDSLNIGLNKYQELKRIKEQLEGILDKYQLKEIKAVGEKFNPAFHEAVDLVESEQESGVIIEEIQKGYILGDKVLRTSKVRVAK